MKWIDDREFVIGHTTFRTSVLKRFESTADRFLVVKPRWAVEWCVELVDRLSPQNVVELGIFQGW